MQFNRLSVIGLTLLLSACGFQLRGTGDMQFGLKEIDLSARNAYGETVKLTKAGLENNHVIVTSSAPYKLILVRDEETSRTVSYTSTAQGAESQITQTLDYEIRGKNDLLLISNQLEVQRAYATDGNNINGSSENADQVRSEMRVSIVQQLLSSIQMLKPAELQALQETAEAKAKMEADALEAERQAEAAELAEQPESIQLPIAIPGQ